MTIQPAHIQHTHIHIDTCIHSLTLTLLLVTECTATDPTIDIVYNLYEDCQLCHADDAHCHVLQIC